MIDNNETGKANEVGKSLEDEEIIELTDEVVNASEEKIIELTDVVEQSPLTYEEKTISVFDDDSETGLVLDEVFDEERSKEQIIEDDFIGSLGMELEAESTQKKDLTSEAVSLSSEQIDEALERVIKRMYSKKIESMIAEMIEKAVTKEIEKMKGILIDGVEGAGKD
ncbi:MAG: hypothetical protein JRD93_06795 [Deltaproteobacteria bacterium]|nr:hypothetical protein [Deltaproteobacteria bacterium]MBW2661684.1 hypothetical protein [Deltaproteobacteria bacterium]